MKVELPFRNLGDFTSLARPNLRNLVFALSILALCLLIPWAVEFWISFCQQTFVLSADRLILVSLESQLWMGVSVFQKIKLRKYFSCVISSTMSRISLSVYPETHTQNCNRRVQITKTEIYSTCHCHDNKRNLNAMNDLNSALETTNTRRRSIKK